MGRKTLTKPTPEPVLPSGPGVYRFTIPDWHPPTLNQVIGRHWSILDTAKKGVAQFLAIYGILQAKVPMAHTCRRVHLLMTGWPRGSFPDKDAFDKIFLDSLKQSRLLVDDSALYLDGRMQVYFVRSKVKSTTVVLEDVP